jgi:hypothetical protein
VRQKRPDYKNAQSIIEAAKIRMSYTLTLDVHEYSASTIITNIYECFRMLGDAILVSKGIVAEDHKMPIEEISKLRIQSRRPILAVLNLRNLRHNINYYGYHPNLSEVQDAVDLARSCFEAAVTEVTIIIQTANV